MDKTQLRKRFESFLWRTGMMVVAAGLAFIVDNIGLTGLPVEVTVIIGLIAGELSKFLNQSQPLV